MPWQNETEEEERRRFASAAMVSGINFSALCGTHGISRKTGYKWRRRYERDAKAGLERRSSRPWQPQGWAKKWRRRLLAWRRRRPSWGGQPLHDWLQRQWPRTRCPSVRTLERWLTQAGVVRRGRRRAKAGPFERRPGRILGLRPNDVWTIDFKGPMRMSNGGRIEPLTVFDLASRYGLAVRPLAAKDCTCTGQVLVELFQRYGLPRAIQVDNGPPFGGGGACGLSKLSVEWVRLGIQVQFGRPACPQDNAEHERWHRTLEQDLRLFPLRIAESTTRRIERLLRIYNTERTHRSLGRRVPAQVYHPSRRFYQPKGPRRYPARWGKILLNGKGDAWWAGRQRRFGRAFARQCLGLRPSEPGQWEVFLDHLLLGTIVATDRGDLRPVQLYSIPPTAAAVQSGEGRPSPAPLP